MQAFGLIKNTFFCPKRGGFYEFLEASVLYLVLASLIKNNTLHSWHSLKQSFKSYNITLNTGRKNVNLFNLAAFWKSWATHENVYLLSIHETSQLLNHQCLWREGESSALWFYGTEEHSAKRMPLYRYTSHIHRALKCVTKWKVLI